MSKFVAGFVMLILLFAGCKKDPIIEPEVVLNDSTLIKISDSFEQELIRQRIDKTGQQDGMIRYGDVKNVDSLFIYANHLIKSLKGIEHFINLRSLTLFMTQQDSLDLSNNEKLEYLNCQTGLDAAGVKPSLKYLEVKNCKKLTYLNCYNNLLTNIDVSPNTALKYLNIGLNTKLREIDLSSNTQLEVFRSEGCWELTKLDVSKNLKLKELYCSSNYKFTSLDVSMLSELVILSCESNFEMKNLYLGKHLKLNYFNISSLPIALPAFENTPNVSHLNINFCNFSLIDFSLLKKLKFLEMYEVPLPTLDLSKNTDLELLDISKTQLTEIDFTHNTKLKWLYCRYQSYLTKLDLRNKALEACQTYNCEKLQTICVDKIPDTSNQNWKTSDWTKYEVCKD